MWEEFSGCSGTSPRATVELLLMFWATGNETGPVPFGGILSSIKVAGVELQGGSAT